MVFYFEINLHRQQIEEIVENSHTNMQLHQKFLFEEIHVNLDPKVEAIFCNITDHVWDDTCNIAKTYWYVYDNGTITGSVNGNGNRRYF